MKVWPMFCKVCGRSIQREDKFCSGCGATIAHEPFESAASVASSTAPAEPPNVGVATAETKVLLLLAAPAQEPIQAAPKSDASAGLGEQIPPPPTPELVESVPPPPAPKLVESVPASPAPQLGNNLPLAFTQGQDSPAPAPPQDGPTVPQFRRCPHCRKINTGTDLSCDWCGTELPPPASAPDPAANIAPPSFAGYAKDNLAGKTPEGTIPRKTAPPSLTVKPARTAGRVRPRSRLPVLEILVIVLLLAGAGIAVWIMRSSLPSTDAAGPSSVVVTITPANAQVVAGRTIEFVATVSGTADAQVIWTVQEGDTGGRVVGRGARAKGGRVSSVAAYNAPDSPGTYHVLATSKADPRQSASAEATVTPR